MNLSKQKKNTTEPKEQPKYNLFQNTGFMLSVAWKSYKSVIFLGIAVIFLAVLTNLAELFIALRFCSRWRHTRRLRCSSALF